MITYAIKKTSNSIDKPCKEAHKVKTKKIGYEFKTYECETWVIDFNDYESLFKFIKKYERLVIEKNDMVSLEFDTIEIYDDIRE